MQQKRPAEEALEGPAPKKATLGSSLSSTETTRGAATGGGKGKGPAARAGPSTGEPEPETETLEAYLRRHKFEALVLENLLVSPRRAGVTSGAKACERRGRSVTYWGLL
jgi:hypothetical protein